MVFLPLGATLIAVAETAVARVGTAIYAVAVSGLYAASAAFHRIPWGPRAWARMRKLDHSMIYVLIAGTYTPFALLVLPAPWSTTILGMVWAGAAAGVALTVFARKERRLRQALYLVLGWMALLAWPVTVPRLEFSALALLVAGGLFYTVGAAMFWLRKPTLNPAVFGYHEMWHAMVIAGSVCHYVMIMSLVLPG